MSKKRSTASETVLGLKKCFQELRYQKLSDGENFLGQRQPADRF